MSVLVPMDPDRRQVRLKVAPGGTGEIVREDPFCSLGMCYRVLRHKDRRVEWYAESQFEYIGEE